MIEHGMEPNIESKRQSGGGLKFALVAIGVGIGLVFGNILDSSGVLYEPVAYFSMAFIFGGLGLLGGYLIEARKIKEQQEKEQQQENNQ